MVEVSLFRLYLLRAMYLFIAVGFGTFILPGILHHQGPWGLAQGVLNCMLVAFWMLAILGLRYPLQMLPVLLWEFVWKMVWLLAVALPAWRYLVAHYVNKAGDPWRSQRAGRGASMR